MVFEAGIIRRGAPADSMTSVYAGGYLDQLEEPRLRDTHDLIFIDLFVMPPRSL